jgi:pimeloyl-ACP methyl ester carboxylesterase
MPPTCEAARSRWMSFDKQQRRPATSHRPEGRPLLAPSALLCNLAFSAAIFTAGTEPAADGSGKRHVSLKSGITMAYQEAGPEDGPPLILLHGLGDTSRSWIFLLPELAKRNRVYVLDLRGHGQTEGPACCYALPDLAYDVVTFMDAMKIESAAIVGHSLGSFIGQHLAAAYGSRVRRLVLIGSADTTVGIEVVDWLWSQTMTFDAGLSSAFVDEWQSNPTPVNADFLAKVKSETSAVPVRVWKGVARALLTEDHRRFLDEVKAPTLILWGEKDPMFPRACQDRLQKALPHAVFKAYADVGHNVHWEIPKQVTEDIEAFIGATRSPR